MRKTKPILEAVRVGPRHEVTIPRHISKALNLKKGDPILIRLVDHRIELVPAALVPKDQLWFWTPEWQAKEREIDEALARGDFRQSSSVEELIRSL